MTALIKIKEDNQQVIEVIGQTNIEMDAISIDSRVVSPGTFFIALKGSMKDGHDFIEEGVQRGASAILMEKPLSESIRLKQYPATFIRVSDTKKTLAHLAPYFYQNPTADLTLVGITGTNGKTTTAYLIEALLHGVGKKTGLLSTIIYRFGGHTKKPKNTTPGLLELQKNMAEMRTNGVTYVIMEVSSHALQQERVAGCQFETSVFTNLSQDHLDYHGTMSAYFSSKKMLFKQTKGKWIINIDDRWGTRLQKEAPRKVWCYGINQKRDIYPLQFRSSLDGIWMIVHTPIGQIEVSSHLVGRYNVYNLLAAIGVGIAHGLSKNEISKGIPALKNVPGRFEKIDCGQNFTVIVDYAHTPDALERLLQAVMALSPNRVITLFGCGGDRDRGKRSLMGMAAAAYSQKIVLTSDNPRSEPPLSIIQEIETGIRSYLHDRNEALIDYQIIPDRDEAIHHVIHLAQAGDVVIIAGKGHETEQQIGEKKLRFDDRERARDALHERFEA